MFSLSPALLRSFVFGAASASLVCFFAGVILFPSDYSDCSKNHINDVNVNVPSNEKTKVLIAGYWRSGSGFLGELFNQNSDTFYMVEPLNGYIYTPSIAAELNRDKSGNPKARDSYSADDFFEEYNQRTPEQLASLLEQIFCCDFANIDAGVLMHRVLRLSRSSYQFNFCLRFDGSNLAKCRPLLTAMCRELKVVAVKEVYASSETVQLLLKRDPSVKVIHLFRDPRAVVLSQRDRNMLRTDISLGESAGAICRQMEKDYKSYQEQVEKHKILRIAYEDMATFPAVWARKVYKFMGIELPAELLHWVEAGTNSKEDHTIKGWLSSTRKKNSTATANAWKHRLRPTEIKEIDNACKSLYKTLRGKYWPIASEQQLQS